MNCPEGPLTTPTVRTHRESNSHSAAPAVLIGTAETAGLLARQLTLLPQPPIVAGCVLLEPVSSPDHPVLGSLDQLGALHALHGFGSAIVSVPVLMKSERLRVLSILSELRIPLREIPPLTDLLSGALPARPARPSAHIDTAELIGRTPHGIDRVAVRDILHSKRVLITGAGGSIGSEIARIAATFAPEQLILMERSENALFEIDRQIARRFPSVPRKAVLHDVVDADRTLRLLVDLRPHAVFHAAAHKHVPLMEDHPAHAVDNNVFGTRSIADAAAAAAAERFVMISSDKAVNPVSVMGATKRLAEMYVQSLHRRSLQAPEHQRTRFCMVRFGNVLGSACSVLPIWESQLAEGGPITVTDERMTRYFMTIPEAAMLVIQAAAMSPEAEAGAAGVYVLDMGDPVRILDLARRMAAAHGFEPFVEGHEHALTGETPVMQITLTGARPGEKLHEELAYAAEQLLPSGHPGINGWAGDGLELPDMARAIASLSSVRTNPDRRTVLDTIRKYVPTLRPEGHDEPLRTLEKPLSKSLPLHNTNFSSAAA